MLKPTLFNIAIVFVWCVTSSAICLANEFPTPRYGGKVQSIKSPIKVRYAPFSRVPATIEQTSHISSDGEKQSARGTSFGAIQGEKWDGGVRLRLFLDRVEIDIGGKQRSENFDFSMSLFIDKDGNFQGIRFDNPGFEADSPEAEQLSALKPLLTRVFPKLPIDPVGDGDTLLDLDFEMNVGAHVMRVSGREIVRGLSNFNGRKVLVADLRAMAHFGTIKMPMRGYGLLDIETGIHLYYDVTSTASIILKGKAAQFSMKQSNFINLPPKFGETPTTGNRSIQQRLERVKRLLRDELITPDEAAEKRREILNAL